MTALTAKAEFSPIYHYGASVQPKRVAWIVAFWIDGTDDRRTCCGTTHGHKTKKAAKECMGKTWKRLQAEAAAA